MNLAAAVDISMPKNGYQAAFRNISANAAIHCRSFIYFCGTFSGILCPNAGKIMLPPILSQRKVRKVSQLVVCEDLFRREGSREGFELST